MQRMGRFAAFKVWMLVWLTASLLASCGTEHPQPGTVQDEAVRAGRTAASFPAADEDYFRDMDGGPRLTPDRGQRPQHLDRVDGRQRSHVGPDELRSASALSISSRRSRHTPRSRPTATTAGNYLGLVNEPCFEKATGADPQRFGLWLDKRRADCPPDPFENEQKYPGVKIGARGKNLPVGSYYG